MGNEVAVKLLLVMVVVLLRFAASHRLEGYHHWNNAGLVAGRGKVVVDGHSSIVLGSLISVLGKGEEKVVNCVCVCVFVSIRLLVWGCYPFQ
jgi:hypothetical protein